MVVLAGLLAVSLLPFAPSAPIGAANTAVEGSLDDRGQRIFGGETRYETSVALATQFYDNSPRYVDEVFVVSGQTGVDAFSSAGLTAVRGTTILLTRQNTLPDVVRDFIIDREFRYVTIVGETDAVSAKVEEELGRTGSVVSVERFGGPDRYDTSAITATEMGRPGFWCDTDERVMFMIGGHSLPDGAVVAPVATKMDTSILQAAQDRLPPMVEKVLREQPVDRIVLVASEAEVGPKVVDALDDLGIAVTRIGDRTPEARSLSLAKIVSAPDCGLVEVANSQFALIRSDHAPGAATVGPSLASSVAAEGGLVPAILVGTRLPSEVRDFLEAIPIGLGARLNDVVLHAIGGPEAITPRVMEDALEAALSSRAYLAIISAEVGESVIKVTFSETVNEWDATNPNNFWVAGSPLRSSDTIEYFDKVTTITLDNYQLRAGDRIRVVGGRIEGEVVGPGPFRNDNRLVPEANLRLPTPRDRIAPHVEVLAVPGQAAIWISVTEDNPLEDPLSDPAMNLLPDFSQLTLDEVTLTLNGTRITANADGSNNPHGLMVNLLAAGFPSPIDGVTQTRFAIQWGCGVLGARELCDERLAGDTAPTHVAVGDRIQIDAGAFVDAFGNRSRAVNHRVAVPTGPPRLVGTPLLDVRATSTRPGPNPTDFPTHAQMVVAVDDGGSPGLAQFRMVARGDGGFPGALGNSWAFVLNKVYDDEGFDEEPTPEVTVNINRRRRVLQVTFDDDASAADIMTVLRQDDTVHETFHVFADETALAEPLFTTPGVDLYGDNGLVQHFSGGLSRARLTLTYSQYLNDLDHSAFIKAQPPNTALGPPSDELGIPRAVGTVPFGSPLGRFNLPTIHLFWVYAGMVVADGRDTINLPAGVVTDSWGRRSEEVLSNVRVRVVS